jgi:hypothetical protein
VEAGFFGSVLAGVVSAVPATLVPTAIAGGITAAALAIRHKIRQMRHYHAAHPHHKFLRAIRHGLALTAAVALSGGVMMAVPYNNFPQPVASGAQWLDQQVAGESVLPAPSLPRLPRLSSTLIAQAKQRGAGKTITVSAIRYPKGSYHEPPTIIVYGPRRKLERLLQREGWGAPGLFPFSPENLNGHRPAFVYEKNAQLGGLSRDHLRDYDMGRSARTGLEEDEIAASRDIAPEISDTNQGKLTFHHRVSHDLVGERNLIVRDILAGDPAASNTLELVKTVRLVHNVKSYPTDGYTYLITLS